MIPKIITAADLCKYLEGCVGITGTVAQDTVKLLFRACVRALADGGAGETIGIGLGNLLAVPGRRSVSGAWRPAFRPSRTFLRYLEKLQARACAGESLGRAFPQMHRKDLVDLLVSGGVRRALADRIAKAAITFWFDRLVSGCAVELPRRCGAGYLEAHSPDPSAGWGCTEARTWTGMGAAITAAWRRTQVLARRVVQVE